MWVKVEPSPWLRDARGGRQWGVPPLPDSPSDSATAVGGSSDVRGGGRAAEKPKVEESRSQATCSWRDSSWQAWARDADGDKVRQSRSVAKRIATEGGPCFGMDYSSAKAMLYGDLMAWASLVEGK